MVRNGCNALSCLAVDKRRRLGSPDNLGVSFHHLQVRADVRRKIYLVYHEKVATFYAKAPLSRVLVAARHIHYVDKVTRERGAEGGGYVVASAFYDYQVKLGVARLHLFYCGNIH